LPWVDARIGACIYTPSCASSIADRAMNFVHGGSSSPHSSGYRDAHRGRREWCFLLIPRCSSALAVLHLLAAPLLQLGLPLAGCGSGLRHACSILVAAPHARIRRPRQPDTVDGDDAPKDPGPIAEKSGQQQHPVRPVGDVPQVLGQTLGLEVLAGALDGAVGGIDGARLLLEEEVDEELRGREGKVEKQRLAGEAGAEEEGAEEPEDEVDNEGEDEGLVEAARVGCGERLDCFLRRLAPADVRMPHAGRLTCAMVGWGWQAGARSRNANGGRQWTGPLDVVGSGGRQANGGWSLPPRTHNNRHKHAQHATAQPRRAPPATPDTSASLPPKPTNAPARTSPPALSCAELLHRALRPRVANSLCRPRRKRSPSNAAHRTQQRPSPARTPRPSPSLT
jgi:hypothetical protein